MRQRILETARNQFFNYGFKKVTIDEIAAELGMSKKTLYQHFPSKAHLLENVIDMTLQELRAKVDNILGDPEIEFLTKLQNIMTFVGSQAARFLRKPFMRDLQKYAPDVWYKLENFRKESIHTRFASLIEEGVRRGYFRNDVDQQIVVLVYFHAVQNIINPETLSDLPFTAAEVFDSIIKMLFEGLLTEEAKTKLRRK